MKLEEIKDLLTKYDNLVELVKSKVLIMEKVDTERYNTCKGINHVNFYEDYICVECDDSSMGCYDCFSFSFPLYFLTLDDLRLENEVEKQKKEREEEFERNQRDRNIEFEKAKEARDLSEFERLKKKYESLTINTKI